jgi:hypothetical protein
MGKPVKLWGVGGGNGALLEHAWTPEPRDDQRNKRSRENNPREPDPHLKHALSQ